MNTTPARTASTPPRVHCLQYAAAQSQAQSLAAEVDALRSQLVDATTAVESATAAVEAATAAAAAAQHRGGSTNEAAAAAAAAATTALVKASAATANVSASQVSSLDRVAALITSMHALGRYTASSLGSKTLVCSSAAWMDQL